MPTGGALDQFQKERADGKIKFDAYLQLAGIKGDATAHDHVGEIFVDSFSFGASNPTQRGQGGGQGAGRVAISDFTVSKFTDSSSPKLFQACCSGTHFKDATLSIRKAGGSHPIDYLKYKFTELFVTKVDWGVQRYDETPTENVSFSFGSLEVIYTPQQKDGSKGAAIVAGWDLKGAKSL